MGCFDGMSRKAIAASEAYWENRGERLEKERQEQLNIICKVIQRLEDNWVDDDLVQQVLNTLACKAVASGKHEWAERLDQCASELSQ